MDLLLALGGVGAASVEQVLHLTHHTGLGRDVLRTGGNRVLQEVMTNRRLGVMFMARHEANCVVARLVGHVAHH